MPNRSIRETIRFGTLFRLVGVRNCPVKHMEPRQRRFSAGRQQACKDKQSNPIVTYPAAQICKNHLRHPLLSYVSEPESKLRKSPTHIIFHIAHRQPKGPTTSLLDGYIYHVATLHHSSPFHASHEKIRHRVRRVPTVLSSKKRNLGRICGGISSHPAGALGHMLSASFSMSWMIVSLIELAYLIFTIFQPSTLQPGCGKLAPTSRAHASDGC